MVPGVPGRWRFQRPLWRQGCREMGEISQTLVDQARFGVRGAGWFEGRSLMRAHSGPELRVLATSSPLIESTFPASIFRRTVRKSVELFVPHHLVFLSCLFDLQTRCQCRRPGFFGVSPARSTLNWPLGRLIFHRESFLAGSWPPENKHAQHLPQIQPNPSIPSNTFILRNSGCPSFLFLRRFWGWIKREVTWHLRGDVCKVGLHHVLEYKYKMWIAHAKTFHFC